MTVFEIIEKNKILPAAVVPKAEQALPLAKALLAGGLTVMEITFRNNDAAECVQRIRNTYPEMTCGAGTLLSGRDIETAMKAGAQFGLSPGFNPEVVRIAVDQGFPFIPGVQTAGEMEQALALGCSWVKFFPAEAVGGVNFLKSVSPPYSHTALRIIPLGGITPDNMAEYLSLPIVPAVGGSWLANPRLLNSENYREIETLSAQARAIAGLD